GSIRLVDGIRLHERGATFTRVGHRALQQRGRDALAAMLAGDDEADDRPHGFVVDGLHHGRALELRELGARPKRDPADRRLTAVRDEAGWRTGVDQRLEGGTIL